MANRERTGDKGQKESKRGRSNRYNVERKLIK
jgi:hypothetical protein